MRFYLPSFLVLAASPALFAADISVSPGQSVQLAIDSATSGDRVLLMPGTYQERIDFGGKDIQVIGVAGAGQTILHGGGAGPVVRFSGGEGVTTRLAGLTVTGGFFNGFGAGGVQCASGSTPSIEDCVIQGNTGKFGGGISGSPFIRRSAILNNTASLTHGGGIYGAPQMRYCIVAQNRSTSADGGGVYLVNGVASIEDCIIIENAALLANSSGGGIYIDSSASVQVRNTLVAMNSATGGAFVGRGGGIYAEAGGSLLENCTVIQNSASGSSVQGAGLFGPMTVNNTILRGNLGGIQVSGASSVRYSNVEGGHAGLGNVDLVSGYVNASARDWHLSAMSPLIDLGDPAIMDEDLTRSDMGAFPFATMYTRSNTQPANWIKPSWPEISLELGGTQVLQIVGAAQSANQPFWTLGSMAGTAPGFMLQGVLVPLNIDPYLIRLGRAPNNPIVSNSLGVLNQDGQTQTVFQLPPQQTWLSVGTLLHHAALLDTTNAVEPKVVTNPASLLIVN